MRGEEGGKEEILGCTTNVVGPASLDRHFLPKRRRAPLEMRSRLLRRKNEKDFSPPFSSSIPPARQKALSSRSDRLVLYYPTGIHPMVLWEKAKADETDDLALAWEGGKRMVFIEPRSLFWSFDFGVGASSAHFSVHGPHHIPREKHPK